MLLSQWRLEGKTVALNPRQDSLCHGEPASPQAPLSFSLPDGSRLVGFDPLSRLLYSVAAMLLGGFEPATCFEFAAFMVPHSAEGRDDMCRLRSEEK